MKYPEDFYVWSTDYGIVGDEGWVAYAGKGPGGWFAEGNPDFAIEVVPGMLSELFPPEEVEKASATRCVFEPEAGPFGDLYERAAEELRKLGIKCHAVSPYKPTAGEGPYEEPQQ